jgi:PX domain
MESTVLVDFDSESKLMFATNSSGVILVTNVGNIVYSADEFQYYQCLFKLIDAESIGKLRVDSISLTSILSRTNLNSDVVEKLLIISMNCINPKSAGLRSSDSRIVSTDSEEVSYISEKEMNDGMCVEIGHSNSGSSASDDASSFLTLHQWLLLCKTILHLQMNPTAEPDQSIQAVISKISDFDNHVTSAPNCALSVSKNDCNHSNLTAINQEINGSGNISTYGYFANFQLGVAVSSPHPTISGAKVTGWEVHCEGFQKSHTKFAISLSVSNPVNVSMDALSAGGGDVPDTALALVLAPPGDEALNLHPSVISDGASTLHVIEAADAGAGCHGHGQGGAENNSQKLSSTSTSTAKKNSKTLKRKNASTKKVTGGKGAAHPTKSVAEVDSCCGSDSSAAVHSTLFVSPVTAPCLAVTDDSHCPRSSSTGDTRHLPHHGIDNIADTHLSSAGSTLTVSSSSSNCPNRVAAESLLLQSHRRYSDFELLASVLRRLYRGVILPPLPPKNWTTQLQQHTQPSQLLAAQRQAELQLFLSALLEHPVLRHSFEVLLFLTTSMTGLNSFRHTFSLLAFDSQGRVVAPHRNKNVVKSSTQFISGSSHLLIF